MKTLFALVMGLLASTSFAHAYLVAATPAPGSDVATPPSEITITFSENVETRFSLFKVYRLERPPSDTKELVKAAKALLEDKLLLTDDAETRADSGMTTTEQQSSVITLGMKDDLPSGTYVVMWRVLSVDTHTTDDVFVFTVGKTHP